MANSNTSVKPTIVTTPNSRFATTFLSTKYRDKAISGEAIMDKISGELFIKRAEDGKIVSFYQNKRTFNELISEFSDLLTNNPSFLYPSTNNAALYVSTNYDLVAINNESLFDLTKDNIIISGTPSDINKLTFKVSGDSNGFFCNNTTRIPDNVFIDFLTKYYNSFFKNYTGTNQTYLNEAKKFVNNYKWENSNAILTYDLVVTKSNKTYTYANNIDYIRLNESSKVQFPKKVYTELGSFDFAQVTIKSITYDKLRFMIKNKDTFGDDFNTLYNKLIAVDKRIEVTEFNVIHFIDNMDDLVILGNENIITTIDVERIASYLAKSQESQIYISDTKPSIACLWFDTSTDN
jgi:hypothetical protein